MRYITALDRGRRVTAVPYQNPNVLETTGLTEQECRSAAWAVTSEPVERRSYHRGAGAINLSLSVALGTRLPHLLYILPGVRQLQDGTYVLVARNRHRLPGDPPHCKQHPEECRE